MRNFLRVGDMDPTPLLASLAAQPELWNQNTLRTRYPQSPHHAVDDIWCWFNVVDETNPLAVADDIHVVPYPAWEKLPQLRPVIFNLMRLVEGVQLGRVLITRLPPGKRITAHADQGAPASWFTRFQYVLQNDPGCTFRCEDEVLTMKPGEAWLFNNELEHEVVNASGADRLAVVADLRRG